LSAISTCARGAPAPHRPAGMPPCPLVRATRTCRLPRARASRVAVRMAARQGVGRHQGRTLIHCSSVSVGQTWCGSVMMALSGRSSIRACARTRADLLSCLGTKWEARSSNRAAPGTQHGLHGHSGLPGRSEPGRRIATQCPLSGDARAHAAGTEAGRARARALSTFTCSARRMRMRRENAV